MPAFVSNSGFSFFFPEQYLPIKRSVPWRAILNRVVRGESPGIKRAIKSTALLMAARAPDKSGFFLVSLPLKVIRPAPTQADLEHAAATLYLGKDGSSSQETTEAFRLGGKAFVSKVFQRAPRKRGGDPRHIAVVFAFLGSEIVIWFGSLSALRASRIQFRNGELLPLLGK